MYSKALFPIHIYQNRIKENHLIHDEVLTKINKIHTKKELKAPEGWLTDKLYTSFNYKDINLELFSGTKTLNLYYDYVYKFFDLDAEVIIDEIWFNHYIDGDYQELHTHIGNSVFRPCSNFSCIHFLSFNPDIHSPVIFMDPNVYLRYSSLEMNSNHYNHQYIPKIEEGTFIMFPSYLQHHVPKSPPTPDYPRISIAMNLQVIKYGNESREY